MPATIDDAARGRKLTALCKALVKAPDLQPEKPSRQWPAGRTFCNVAVARAFHEMGGLTIFGDGQVATQKMLANGLIATAQADSRFKLATPQVFQEWANRGGLCFAALEAQPHGHVALGAPSGVLVWSPKWQAWAPTVANVGGFDRSGANQCGVKSANWAFGRIPDFYVFTQLPA